MDTSLYTHAPHGIAAQIGSRVAASFSDTARPKTVCAAMTGARGQIALAGRHRR